MSRPVYATVPDGKGGTVRLGAQMADGAMVLVWKVNGAMLGQYRLERFPGSRLTAGTLAVLFSLAPVGVTS